MVAKTSEQPTDSRTDFKHVVRPIKAHGLPTMCQIYLKHLQDKLREVRLTGHDGIARALYAVVREQKFVVLRVFSKKSRKPHEGRPI